MTLACRHRLRVDGSDTARPITDRARTRWSALPSPFKWLLQPLLGRLPLAAHLQILAGLLEAARLACAAGRDLKFEFAACPLDATHANERLGHGFQLGRRNLSTAQPAGSSIDMHCVGLR